MEMSGKDGDCIVEETPGGNSLHSERSNPAGNRRCEGGRVLWVKFMIKVYFETAIYSELVAVVSDEETYMACLPGLKKLAKSQGMFVAESLIEDRKLEDNRRRRRRR
jgi:hypothetical protein